MWLRSQTYVSHPSKAGGLPLFAYQTIAGGKSITTNTKMLEAKTPACVGDPIGQGLIASLVFCPGNSLRNNLVCVIFAPRTFGRDRVKWHGPRSKK